MVAQENIQVNEESDEKGGVGERRRPEEEEGIENGQALYKLSLVVLSDASSQGTRLSYAFGAEILYK